MGWEGLLIEKTGDFASFKIWFFDFFIDDTWDGAFAKGDFDDVARGKI